MSAPRTKRQFAGASADPAQRQITSFFNASNPSETTAAAAPSTSEVRQPTLPSSVQSNLLSVGMRVRKSVPEGYKTDGTSAFKLWTDNSPVPTTTAFRTPTKRGAGSRELLPFCGINRVGGLASQPDVVRDYDDEVPDLDDVPGLTMSQESAPDSSRKRIYDDDDAEDDFAASPASFAAGSDAGRVMAVPRSRTGKKNVTSHGQGSGDDFDDADFLVFGRSM